MGAVPLAQIPGDQAGFRLPPPLSLSDELRRNRQDPAPSKFNSAWSNKGVAWSETEHLAFLKGLQAFGKGQWKQISRYYVPSRTPTQVASHAQKHFLRVNGATKRRSRFSTLEENVQQLSGVTSPQNPSGGRSSGGGANSATTGSCAKLQGTPAATPPPSFPLAREYSSASVLPPNADGLAIGIPWAYHTPMISTPNGKLPLLRVHPGRIDVTKMSTSNGENSKLTYPKLRSPVDPSPKRKMEALKMGDDSKGHLAVLHEISQRLKAESVRTKRRRQHQHQHHSPRSSEFADSECGEHGDTSAALSALDALAGVAAALADSD